MGSIGEPISQTSTTTQIIPAPSRSAPLQVGFSSVLQELLAKDDETMHREKRLQPIYVESGKTAIDPDRTEPILKGMAGMDEVSNLLWNVLVKPAATSEYYRNVYGRLGALHFAVVGPNGCGKKTAISTICNNAATTIFFIEANAYVNGDVAFAIAEACKKRPAVVCFDGFEALNTKPGFHEEFAMQVLGSKPLLTTWNMVWLAFCVENPATITNTTLARIVGLRVAKVKSLDGPSAADILMRVFLPPVLPLLEPLTNEQKCLLESAAVGCTPSELKEFASNIVISALSRHNLGDLASMAGNRVFGTKQHNNHPQSQSVDPNTPQTNQDARSGYCGRPSYTAVGTRTQTVGNIAEQVGCEDDDDEISIATAEVPRIYISWKEDAEPLYEKYQDANFVIRRRIPRFEQRSLDSSDLYGQND
jgi:hypothetical protein